MHLHVHHMYAFANMNCFEINTYTYTSNLSSSLYCVTLLIITLLIYVTSRTYLYINIYFNTIYGCLNVHDDGDIYAMYNNVFVISSIGSNDFWRVLRNVYSIPLSSAKSNDSRHSRGFLTFLIYQYYSSIDEAIKRVLS